MKPHAARHSQAKGLNPHFVLAQAPTLHAAISSRMSRCLHAMHAALAKMQPDLDPLLSGKPSPLRVMQTLLPAADQP